MAKATTEAVSPVIRRSNATVAGRGDGPVMLFAHGYGCDQDMWRRLVPFFADDYKLDRVGCDSLILQCSDDLLAPPEVGSYVHRHIPGSTLVQLKATGHCPHVSAPEDTAAAILEYLAFRP